VNAERKSKDESVPIVRRKHFFYCTSSRIGLIPIGTVPLIG
jgi:hypothetical protein